MYYRNYSYTDGNRQFFVPFLLGGLAGSALVGFSRPRPVYVNSPAQYNPYYRPYYGPGNYYNYSGGGYY